MVSMLRIVTFGEATIAVDGERIAPSAHRMFALALHLAAERGRSIPRAVVQAELFGDCDERAGSHNLRQIVYRLRRLGAPIVTTLTTLSVAADDVTTDYGALLDTPRLSPEQLEVVAKGFLPGYAPDVSDAYREWVDSFRNRVTLALRRKALDAMAAAHERCDWDAVARAADACLALDPLNEDAVLGRAEALAMSGSKAEALERIERYLSELPSAAEDCRAAARRLRQRIMRRVSEPAPLSLREMPLVGREEEMRRLTSALARTRSEGGGVVLITGEPGIGKTRLLTEFERLAALSGAQTARVVCRASTSHQPLSPFIELTRLLLQMPGALGCSPEALERLRGLSRHQPNRAADSEVLDFDANDRFASIGASLIDLIDAIATEGVLIVSFDDVQWLDETSIDIIGSIVRSLSSRPSLLLLAGRTGWATEPHWAFLDQCSTIHLAALQAGDSRKLVSAYSKSATRPLEEQDSDWVLRFGRGNPLYLQLLCASDRTEREDGSVPLALRELLRQRIDWLQSHARAVLDATALLARHASASRLEAVLELAPLELISVLRQLELAGVIVREEFNIALAHPLVGDIIRTTIPDSVRLLLHHRIAEVLSRIADPDGGVAVLWDSADHWIAAGNIEQAALVLRQCAAHCLTFGRPVLAMRSLDRALSTEGLSGQTRFALLRDQSLFAGMIGDWSRVLSTLDQMERIQPSQAERPRLASESEVLRLDALRVVDDAAPLCEGPWRILIDHQATPDTRMRAAAFLVAHAEDYFDPELAARTRTEVATFSSDVHITGWVGARYWLIHHACFGDMRRLLDMSRQIAYRLQNSPIALDQINLHYNVAYALARCGARFEAFALLERLRSVVCEWELGTQETWCLTWMAWLAAEGSDWAKAGTLLSSAVESAARTGIELPVTHHFVASGLALHERDGLRALRILSGAGLENTSGISPRRRLHVTQLKVRAQHLLGKRQNEDDVAILVNGHLAGRAMGMHDEIAGALYIALRDTGAVEEARTYLREYLGVYRRDPFAVPEDIASMAQSLGPLSARPA